jgi:fatty-acyl-CoA synthase
VDVMRRLQKLKRTAEAVGRGALLFRRTGLSQALSPKVALAMARDSRRGRKGTLAVVHLHALADPLRPAVVSIPGDSPDQRFSYGELEQRIHRLTHGLRALGLGPGERIGAFLHNGHEYLELNAALGVVGGTNVQIGYRLKGAEVAYYVENSGARALLFHNDLAPAVEEMLKELPAGSTLKREACIAVGGAPGFRSYEDLLASGDPMEPAMVPGGGYGGVMVYTSGTTGKSKGAKRDFKKMGVETLMSFISQFPLNRDDRHLVLCPLYHSMAPAFAMMVSSVGGCNVILRHFDPENVLRVIERERITCTLVVPTMLARIMALPNEVLRRYDTSSMRWIMSGAAPLPTDLARRVEDSFGPILYNFYGATESGLVTLALPGEHTARPGTIGRAIGGNHVRLLDGEGRDVPVGQVGELYTRNSMMMDGYHGNEAATKAAMREGYVSVGDMASCDGDGYYYLADRKTDMVISGGVNIYPWEIEQRLHEHVAVLDAAVVGVPDAEWGESLAAFIVLQPGQQASAEELIDHVRTKLADYKRPRRVWFLDALPRNPTGKILKRELKKQAADLVAQAKA